MGSSPESGLGLDVDLDLGSGATTTIGHVLVAQVFEGSVYCLLELAIGARNTQAPKIQS